MIDYINRETLKYNINKTKTMAIKVENKIQVFEFNKLVLMFYILKNSLWDICGCLVEQSNSKLGSISDNFNLR